MRAWITELESTRLQRTITPEAVAAALEICRVPLDDGGSSSASRRARVHSVAAANRQIFEPHRPNPHLEAAQDLARRALDQDADDEDALIALIRNIDLHAAIASTAGSDPSSFFERAEGLLFDALVRDPTRLYLHLAYGNVAWRRAHWSSIVGEDPCPAWHEAKERYAAGLGLWPDSSSLLSNVATVLIEEAREESSLDAAEALLKQARMYSERAHRAAPIGVIETFQAARVHYHLAKVGRIRGRSIENHVSAAVSLLDTLDEESTLGMVAALRARLEIQAILDGLATGRPVGEALRAAREHGKQAQARGFSPPEAALIRGLVEWMHARVVMASGSGPDDLLDAAMAFVDEANAELEIPWSELEMLGAQIAWLRARTYPQGTENWSRAMTRTGQYLDGALDIDPRSAEAYALRSLWVGEWCDPGVEKGVDDPACDVTATVWLDRAEARREGTRDQLWLWRP